MLALETLRAEQDVPLALQRIRPLNVSGSDDWHELLIRPVGIEPGHLIKFGESIQCAAEVDLIIARSGLPRARPVHGRISLNVSGQSVSDKSFLTRLVSVLKVADFPFSRLVIEITETAQIIDYRTAIYFADWVRNEGAWIALDDVTDTRTTMPIRCLDVIKVDRSLIQTCVSSNRFRSMLRAIADTAHHAEVHSVAEGVEDQNQLAVVASLGFSYYQGFLQDSPFSLL